MIINNSSDRFIEEKILTKDGFNVLKRGLVTVAPSDFISLFAFKTETVYTYYNGLGGSPDFLLTAFDVYHYAQDPANELTSEQVDEIIMKTPYTDEVTGQRLNVAMGYETFAGGPDGQGGVNVKLIFYYKADASSGSPFSADETQNFYYVLYSLDPIIRNP